MAKEGKLCPVKIENVRHVYYVLERYLSALEAAENSSIEEKIYFIAPLDNLIWNRRMISEIFNFDYSWEVYKVPEKRQYGYYVLPILFGTSFVGRVDPKLDRADRTMIINSLVLEKEDLREDFLVELAAALTRFLGFHETSKIKIIKTKPKRLRNELLSKLASVKSYSKKPD